MKQKADEILKKVNEITDESSTSVHSKSSIEKLDDMIIPGMNNSKSILSSIYSWQPNQKNGFIGKIKNSLLIRLKNIIVNVTERQSMKQQKFNELTYKAIVELTEELRKQRVEEETKQK